MSFDPKKWLYNAHKYTSPSPTALKWMVPLATAPLAYYGHKLASKAVGGGMKSFGKTIHGMGMESIGNSMHNAGGELQKSNPLMFAAAVTALNTALSQGIYRPRAEGRKAEMKDWKSFFYPDTIEKTSAWDPMIMSAANLEQGWQHDPLMKAEIKRHKWMVPSVDSRRLKESIWDTPGFTPGQKTFLGDSVDGATQVADNDYLSMNDLGIGVQRAIVNNRNKVPGLAEVTVTAGMRAAEGAFLGYGLGTLLGGTPPTVRFLQNAGLVTGVLNTSPAMKKIKSYF